MEKQRGFLSGNMLKMIAIITMAIDHVAASRAIPLDMNSYLVMRSIGRIAFPIFCFLLVQGAWHTSNIRKYAIRMGTFAIISEIPFNMAIHRKIIFPEWSYLKHHLSDYHHIFNTGMSTNVFFTLTFGLLMLWALKECRSAALRSLSVIVCCGLAHLFGTDYGACGVLVILCFAIASSGGWRTYLGYAMFVAVVVMGFCDPKSIGTQAPQMAFLMNIEAIAILALIPITLYNGRRKNINFEFPKYFFYIFYPAHLLVLGLIVMLR